MRRAAILSLSLPFALSLALAASADTGAAWDDSHMQSNFARQRGPAPPRPAVQGANRFSVAAEHPAPTPPTGVAETTLRISPLEWTPGGPTATGGSSTPPWAAARGGSRSDPRPTASSGVRTGSSGRGGSSAGQHSRR